MKNDAIEDFIETLAQSQRSAQEEADRLTSMLNWSRFCYNMGRGRMRWKDVAKVRLVPGTVYLIRRVFWATPARRKIVGCGVITLARWPHGAGPWEVLSGCIPGSTASLAGIQVYE